MEQISPIHMIGIIVSLALFYQSILLVQKRKESVFEFLLWTGMGAAILTLSIGSLVTVIDILDGIEVLLRYIGFNSGRDGIFVLSIISLLMILFYTYINAKTNRKHLYDLNQELALVRYEMSRFEEKSIEEKSKRE